MRLLFFYVGFIIIFLYVIFGSLPPNRGTPAEQPGGVWRQGPSIFLLFWEVYKRIREGGIMKAYGFDNEKYLEIQSQQIQKRINMFDNKLYLEMGGKLFDDYHASRVLPGFLPDSKVKMLSQLASQVEIVIAINAGDIEKNKVRSDIGITYDADVLRLIDAFRGIGLYVGSVVLTQYAGQPSADAFRNHLESLGVKVFLHYPIEGYPSGCLLYTSRCV